MADVMRVKERFSPGPRLLVAVVAVAIALGVALFYADGRGQTSYLFFFFLPIAAVSVVLGRIVALLLAFLSIGMTLLPSVWLGLDRLVAPTAAPEGRAAILTVWAVFLIATGYLVGWIAERAGSLRFAQGAGGQAIRAMEWERRRTGQDLHDGIAQYAAAASLEAQVLADMTAETAPLLNAQAERVKQSLDLLVSEARTMIGNLRPPALGPAEFNTTMAKLAETFQNRTGIPLDLELEGDFGAHTDSARICIYRIAQEALANVEQHAEATQVRMWAQARRRGVDLVVSDNGKGFDPNGLPATNGDHFGLEGMRERAEYLGGWLIIESGRGAGTNVALHIPRYRGGGNGRWS